MRDRLIEIFRKINYHNRPDGLTANLATQFSEYALGEIVDALFASGVIVPPVKVGDTVYVIIDIDNPARRMLECKAISISMEETGMHFQFQTVKKYLYRYGNFDIDDIGKTVFLTKEQAEKALAEVAK